MTYFATQPAWFTTACVIALLILYVGFVPLGYAGRIARRYEVKIPEATPFYSRRGFTEFLQRIGANGLPLYRRELGWDILFAILLAPPMVAVLDAIWATSLEHGSWLRILVFVPLVIAVVDVLEDALLSFVTSRVRFKSVEDVTGQQTNVKAPTAGVEIFASGVFIAAQAATAIKFLSLAVSIALVLAGGINHAVKRSPSPTAPQNSLHVSFTYEMADRLTRQSDGTLRYLSVSQIQNREFVITLDACDSTSAVDYNWNITTKQGKALSVQSTTCLSDIRLPEGRYPVQLTLTFADGNSATTEHEIEVRDWLIVSIGDSYASGEGAPDVAKGSGHPAQWQDAACHRSTRAGVAQAAYTIETEDPQTSVTFVHVACSGATVRNGLLGAQKPRSGTSKGSPQIAQVHNLVGGRKIDALLVSIGGNDINFRHIIESCLVGHCGTKLGDAQFSRRLADLSNRKWPSLFSCLTEHSCVPGVDGLGLAPSDIFVSTYPDPTTFLKNGAVEDCRYGFHLLRMTRREFRWARETVLTGLNSRIRDVWKGSFDTHVVSFGHPAWTAHGICAGEASWFQTLGRSQEIQGGPNGSFHPNATGYLDGYAPAVVRALRAAEVGVPVST